MEEHPDYVACVHANKVIDYLNNTETINARYDQNQVVNTVDVLSPMVPIFHTTSIFYKKQIINERPDFFKDTWDYADLVYFALCGKIYYINKVMSVYRTLTPGSWTMRTREKKNRKAELGFQKYHVDFSGLFQEIYF